MTNTDPETYRADTHLRTLGVSVTVRTRSLVSGP